MGTDLKSLDQGLTDLTVKLLPKAGQGCGVGLGSFCLAFLLFFGEGECCWRGGGGLEDLQVGVEEDLGLRVDDVGLLVEEDWGLVLRI